MPKGRMRYELVRGELRTMTPAGFEVISPNDTFHEVQAKALEWLAAGTIIVLVLDPDQHTATVYRGQGDTHVHRAEDTLDLSDAVPGFTVPVARLFA
jgi:Uma2 family endonuclease